jgi:hypothetical protein
MESHEEEARRLLAAELRLIGPEVMNVGGMDRVADSVINGTHRFVVIRAAIRAIVRVLRQEQSPSHQKARTCKGTNCNASSANGYEHSSECVFEHARAVASGVKSVSLGATVAPDVEYIEWHGHRIDLAGAIAALQQAQQPGAQGAVAVVGDDLYPAWVDDAPDLPPGTKLYTAPHPLPEGVSEEDVEAEAISLWHRFAPDDRIEWDEEPHKAEYRDAARSILESYRARLAAKGGV